MSKNKGNKNNFFIYVKDFINDMILISNQTIEKAEKKWCNEEG